MDDIKFQNFSASYGRKAFASTVADQLSSAGYARAKSKRYTVSINADPVKDCGFDPDKPQLFIPDEFIDAMTNVVIGEIVTVRGTMIGFDRDYLFKVKRWNVERHGWDCEWVD